MSEKEVTQTTTTVNGEGTTTETRTESESTSPEVTRETSREFLQSVEDAKPSEHGEEAQNVK